MADVRAAYHGDMGVLSERGEDRGGTSAGERVTLELMVDFAAPDDAKGPWFDALLWVVGADPRLVESQHFGNAADLRVWLKAVAVEHGLDSITVRWTEKLRTNRPLCHLLGVCLGVAVP
jgi:hypothetical protein